MNLLNNIGEALKAIQANLLRTILTVFIIAIGITSLVGILTAIDSIQTSVTENFSDLGVNSFTIRNKRGEGQGDRKSGRVARNFPPITYTDIKAFDQRFAFQDATVSVSARVSGNTEVKRLSFKTNPNVQLYGSDQNYILSEGFEVVQGRNFSEFDIKKGANVAIIGSEIRSTLFLDGESPINKEISLYGNKFKVIGTLKEMGAVGGGGNADRRVIIPVQKARQIGGDQNPDYRINVLVKSTARMQAAMGEATNILRNVRQDPIGEELSFEITEKKSLSERLGEISGYLRMGGFVIGFITLVGASIALMNIMMVSVTERTREIGIRKALGATPLRIRQQFLIEAIVICQIGGLLGIVMGILIGNVVTQIIDAGVFIIPWLWMVVALIICGMVGIFSGYYPAFKASKLDPIESLRYE